MIARSENLPVLPTRMAYQADAGHQGRGIGTRIISALVEEAEHEGQDLVLDVLTVNRRAQTLYQRLGLTEVARHGDRGAKLTMRSAHHRTQRMAGSPRRCKGGSTCPLGQQFTCAGPGDWLRPGVSRIGDPAVAADAARGSGVV
jgi:hypothetical protein